MLRLALLVYPIHLTPKKILHLLFLVSHVSVLLALGSMGTSPRLVMMSHTMRMRIVFTLFPSSAPVGRAHPILDPHLELFSMVGLVTLLCHMSLLMSTHLSSVLPLHHPLQVMVSKNYLSLLLRSPFLTLPQSLLGMSGDPMTIMVPLPLLP